VRPRRRGALLRGPSTSPLDGPLMPEQTSATGSRNSRGKAAAVVLLGTIAAFVTAWFLSGAFCFLAPQLGLRLPSFTCGRNFGLSFLVFFAMSWPMFVFLWPLLFRKPQ
jgi:hypothetical protein